MSIQQSWIDFPITLFLEGTLETVSEVIVSASANQPSPAILALFSQDVSFRSV